MDRSRCRKAAVHEKGRGVFPAPLSHFRFLKTGGSEEDPDVRTGIYTRKIRP